MRVASKIAGILSLLLWCFAGYSQNISNKGREFWVGYGHHQYMESGTNAQDMTLYLSAEAQPATVKVTIDSAGGIPSTTWWSRTYTIPPYTVISIETATATSSTGTGTGLVGPIPKGGPGFTVDARLFTIAPPAGTGGAGLFRRRGIHIESNNPIVAYAHIYGSASSGATMLFPVEAWGYSYVSLNSNQGYPSAGCYSWSYVVAKENNTIVEITPSVKTRAQNITGLRPGVPMQVTLQKGQIYQVIGALSGSDANGNGGSSTSGEQLTGTTIKSVNCKSIAVFSGSSRTSNQISCGSGGGDNDNQQLFPEHSWGKRYLTAPFSGTPATAFATSMYKVAVKDPSTIVKRNGITLTGLQNGNYYQFESSTADLVEADKPISVAQFMTGGGCIPGSWGDPEMVVISPVEQATKQTGFFRNDDEGISTNYVTLVVPNRGTGLSSLRIAGLSSFTHTYTHPANPNYTVVIQSWPAAKAQVLVRGDSAFTGITYGIGSVESYGYNIGAQLNDLRALKHIRNVYDSINPSNTFTCKNTPFKLSALLSFQPTRITWKLDTLGLPLTPNTRIVQNNPTPSGTQVINGETYYLYELPGTYKFTQSGTFYVPIETLEPSAVCDRKDQMYLEFIVKDPPKADFTWAQGGCGNNVFNFSSPAADGTGFTIKNWWWNFGDGVRDSASQNPSHAYTADGTYNVQLSVVSQEGCVGDTTKAITVANVQVSASIVATPPNVCQGGTITFTDTVTTATGIASWWWDFGNGQTVTVTSNTPQTATYNTPGTYIVKHTANKTNSGSCGADTITKTITVYPKPVKPVVTNLVTYCQNSTPTALTATALAGHTLTWYTAFPGTGSSATPTPSTSSAGTTSYYVTQTSANSCISDTARIDVTVVPSITANTIAASQTVCSGSPAATLNGTVPAGGANNAFVYQWQMSTDGGTTWTNITGGTLQNYSPGVLSTGITKFRRIANSGLCSDTSNVVDITVETNLSNYNISSNQTICEGTAPALLDGQSPGGGTGTYSFQWQGSTDGINWTAISGATLRDYQPGVLSVRTYFRRVTTGGNCPAISNVVVINLNPTANGTITTATAAICQYDAGSVTFTSTAGTAPFAIQLLVTSPSGTTTTISQTVAGTSATINVIPANSAPGNYTIALQSVSDNGGCIRTTGLSSVTIGVTATPSLVFNPVTPVICAGGSIQLNVTGAATYTWSPATGLSATTGTTVTANPLATTTYSVTGTVAGCNGTTTIMVTVNPRPAKPVATTSVTYCQNGTATALTATALAGHTLTWYNNAGLTGGSTTAPTPSTAAGGTVSYYVTQTNTTTTCVSEAEKIDVTITPSITGNTVTATQTVCSGLPAAALTSAPLGGGTGTFAYQWQQSTDGGTTWTNITGGTLPTYNPGTLATGVYQFRRIVTSGLCTSTSNAVTINVETNLSNYNITASQTICEGATPAQIDGQPPTGGTGTYSYAWQSSPDGITWTTIAGATSRDYQPGSLTTNIYYRRITTGGNCPATSNAVLITVNPTPNGSITAPTAICSYDAGSVSFTATAGTAPYTVVLTITAPGGGTSTVTQTIATNGPAAINVIPVNSAAGTYTVQLTSITDGRNCPRTSGLNSINITVTAKPNITISGGALPSCEGTPAPLLANGATTYTWSPSTGLSATTGASITATPAATTTYQVIGTTNGCYDTADITVTVIARPAKPAVTAQVSYCLNEPATQLAATALAGHTLTWYTNANLTGGSATAPTPLTTAEGTVSYYVTQTNSNNCVSEASVITVTTHPLPAVSFTMPTGVCMPNGVAQFTNGSSIAGGGNLTYAWNFGDLASGSSNTSVLRDPSHVFSDSDGYNVTLTVTSAFGCTATNSQNFSAFFNKPVADFDVNPDALCQGQDNFFTDLSDPSGSTINKWQWFFGDGKTESIQNPTHRYTQPGNYTVKLVVSTVIGCVSDTFPVPVIVYLQPRIDAGPSFVVPEGTTIQFKATANDTTGITLTWSPAIGLSNAGWLKPSLTVRQNQTYTLTAVGAGNCTSIDTMTVRILKPIEVPNVFSPNGDGTNDRWMIPNLADYPGAKVEIFNRWGQQIFLSYGYNKAWDGTHLGKPLPLATYYYVITLNNGFKPVTGSVTIIK